MIVLKAERHQNNWFSQGDIGPSDWFYATSFNGYIDNELGLLWLEQVFEKDTSTLVQSDPRILITGGHGSHGTADFLTFCFTHNILFLRLLAHTSHFTQPLDVGCFSALKTYYRQKVEKLCQGSTNLIEKRTFIDLYVHASKRNLTQNNIESGWRGIGLYPFNLEMVLAKFALGLKRHQVHPLTMRLLILVFKLLPYLILIEKSVSMCQGSSSWG